MAAAVLANPPQGIQPTRDSHSECALAVQHETKIAIEAIKSRGIMNSSEWANPLTAAPSAVGTMAILLKTASSTVAAGIPVQMRAIKNARGETIGKLQSTLLHSNLQACSDLGRSAFSEARNTMDYINKVALNMTQNKGKIETILRLIETPKDEDEDEDAADDLSDEIDDVKESTTKCLEKIQKLTEDFHYWYWVICIIKENVLEGQGKTQEKANRNEDDQNAAIIAQAKHSDNEANARKVIKELEVQLEDAKNRVLEAQKLTEKLANLPPIPEPPMEEELLRADKAIPIEQRKVGIWGKVKEKFAGESSEEFAARQTYLRGVEARRNEYMEKEKKKRDEEREKAERALKKAREFEESLRARIRTSVVDLSKNRDRLASIKANLEKTESQFKRLSDERVELADILAILQHSASQLGELKKQVHDLDTFFKSILNDVNITVEDDVGKGFLRPIDKGIRTNRKGQVVGFKLSKTMKEKVRDSALRIQASFCAIRDISRVYVTISDRYITEAINQMETLSCLQGEEWETKRANFFEWCHKSMGEIDGLTEAVAQELEENMKERVARLAQLTIEPAH